MKNNEEIKLSIFNEIKNSDRKFLGFDEYPEYGKIVMTGLIQGQEYDFEHAIGYVVQIRCKRGQYGSDQYLVRHSDGILAVHENQSFWLVPDSLAEKALELFVQTPCQEGGDTEYSIGADFPETGYLIEFNEGDPTGDSPSFGLVITTS